MGLFEPENMLLSDEEFIRKNSRELSPLNTPKKSLPNSSNQKLTGIRCILFDIYGTLLISKAGDTPSENSDVFHEILKFTHSPNTPFEEFTKLIHESHAKSHSEGIDYPEVNIIEIWSTFFQTIGSRKLTANEIQRIALAYELKANPTWPMPYSSEMLEYLKRTDLTLGIISNAQFYTAPIIESLFGNKLHHLGFSTDLCSFSYERGRAKPYMKLFEDCRLTLKLKGISAEEVLYIGNDLLKDVHTASRAGFKTALFCGDDQSLRLHQGKNLRTPDTVLYNFNDLIEILQK